MTINELVYNLIEKTKKDELTWEQELNGSYRLITTNGSVNIGESTNVYGLKLYTIRLYDEDSCFATYSSEPGKNDDSFCVLYKEIVSYNNRLIEKKIQNLFGEI